MTRSSIYEHIHRASRAEQYIARVLADDIYFYGNEGLEGPIPIKRYTHEARWILRYGLYPLAVTSGLIGPARARSAY